MLGERVTSASVVTPSDGCAASAIGCLENWITGTKSFSGSKLILNTCGAPSPGPAQSAPCSRQARSWRRTRNRDCRWRPICSPPRPVGRTCATGTRQRRGRPIGRAAGRERHDEVDRTDRPILCRRGERSRTRITIGCGDSTGSAHRMLLLTFVSHIDYRTISRPSINPGSSCHIPISARPHGLDRAHAARPVRRRLLCRAEPGLYRRHVRH